MSDQPNISNEAREAAKEEISARLTATSLGYYVQALIDSLAAKHAEEMAKLNQELAPLRELVGVDPRAASALSDIHTWTKMMDKADSAEVLRADNDRLKGELERVKVNRKDAWEHRDIAREQWEKAEKECNALRSRVEDLEKELASLPESAAELEARIGREKEELMNKPDYES